MGVAAVVATAVATINISMTFRVALDVEVFFFTIVLKFYVHKL